MELSRSIVKLVRSLEARKYRERNGLFVAEGPKTVRDIARRITPRVVIATRDGANDVQSVFAPHGMACPDSIIVTEGQLRRLSFLKEPQGVLALFPLPDTHTAIQWNGDATQKLVIALDAVQDPGNIGTIARIAHWFGIDTVLCGTGTADPFAPKAVQASMGSVAAVRFIHTALDDCLATARDVTHVYGTLLDGENIYSRTLTEGGVLLFGNEGKGISDRLRRLVTDRLLIPRHNSNNSPDSLNVAATVAITCAEFRRRTTERNPHKNE